MSKMLPGGVRLFRASDDRLISELADRARRQPGVMGAARPRFAAVASGYDGYFKLGFCEEAGADGVVRRYATVDTPCAVYAFSRLYASAAAEVDVSGLSGEVNIYMAAGALSVEYTATPPERDNLLHPFRLIGSVDTATGGIVQSLRWFDSEFHLNYAFANAYFGLPGADGLLRFPALDTDLGVAIAAAAVDEAAYLGQGFYAVAEYDDAAGYSVHYAFGSIGAREAGIRLGVVGRDILFNGVVEFGTRFFI